MRRLVTLISVGVTAMAMSAADAGAQQADLTLFLGKAFPVYDERLTLHPSVPTLPGAVVSVEAGIADMLDRMLTGRLKVAKHLTEWFEEFRLYHRKDGKIVKEYDDLLSATRYLIMMLRYAMTKPVVSAKWKGRQRASWRTA